MSDDHSDDLGARAEALGVLAIAAHPDDVELGMGGTMLRFRDAGHRTGVLDLTAGEKGSRGTAATRAQEARRSSRLMGLSVRETLGFPDTELVADLPLRKAIVAAVRRHRPRILFAPYAGDLHPDHAAAGRAVSEAFYPCGMKNFDAPGEPYRPARLFFYCMHDVPETDLVMDVSAVWERRLEVARCFASQLHAEQPLDGEAFPTLISQPDFLVRLEARARAWGRRAGVDFGEPLLPRTPLGIADPGTLLLP